MKKNFLSFILLLSLTISAQAAEIGPVTLNTRLNVALFGDSQLVLSHMNVADPDFMANYFLTPYQSIGAGVDAYLSTETLSLWSWRVAYKYFFVGEGYPIISEADQYKIEQFSKYGFYTGIEAKNYNYFISSKEKKKITINNENINSTGNYYNINLLLGYEYRFNNRYAINLEASQAVLAIAASDERFSSKASILLFGLTIKL